MICLICLAIEAGMSGLESRPGHVTPKESGLVLFLGGLPGRVSVTSGLVQFVGLLVLSLSESLS